MIIVDCRKQREVLKKDNLLTQKSVYQSPLTEAADVPFPQTYQPDFSFESLESI